MQHPQHKPAPVRGAEGWEAPNKSRQHYDYQRRCLAAYRQATANGTQEHHVNLDEIATLPFEDFLPYHESPSYRGQPNIPGFYFFATNGEHIAYQRRIRERRALVMLDFDPSVTSVVAQPFALLYPDDVSSEPGVRRGKHRCHVPCFLARTTSDRDRLIDVWGGSRNPDVRPGFERALEFSSMACEYAGWSHEVLQQDPVEYANVEWLSGFRRPLRSLALLELADQILEAVEGVSGAIAVGDLIAYGCPGQPGALTRPVVYHLLWRHELSANLSEVLSDRTLVRRPCSSTHGRSASAAGSACDTSIQRRRYA
jgi:hypothetical protein